MRRIRRQIKYAFSNATEEMPLEEMIRASTMRWPIEQCFEEGKGKIGMDHYEHRSWTAWHRHMIYVFLGLLFLHRLRVRFKKNSCYDGLSSQYATSGGVAAPLTRSKGGH